MKHIGVYQRAGLFPVLFAFLIMGLIDVVGISTSYAKKDFALSDTLANLLPMMAFIWFALISFPTGIVMGKVGRKNTVLFSLALTVLAMVLPLLSYSFPIVLLAFMILGISNTILQVSLNPLLLNTIAKEKITSMLTLGQFIKAVSSMLGPALISLVVGVWGDWKNMFLVYAILSFVSFAWLASTKIPKEVSDESTLSIKSILSLFADTRLLLYFSMILLSVGFEIGLMTGIPKYFTDSYSFTLESAGLGCSLYYLFRMSGTFAGSFILARYSERKFLLFSLVIAVISYSVFMCTDHVMTLLIVLSLLGLSCANIFPIVYSMAIQKIPEKANEISAMMIMGVAGGAIMPFAMGIVTDWFSLWGSLLLPFGALIYMLISSVRLK